MRTRYNTAKFQMAFDQVTELKGYSIIRYELKIRQRQLSSLTGFDRASVSLSKACRHVVKRRSASRFDVLVTTVRTKKALFIQLVARQKARHSLSHPGVPCERAVLGPRQEQSPVGSRRSPEKGRR